METAINLLHQHLQIAIGERKERTCISSTLSALRYFDPFQTTTTRGFCFLWITDILNSGYTMEERYSMAGKVVELVWKHIRSEISDAYYEVETAWIPPLVAFLQLSEEFYTTGLAPGVLALRILSTGRGYGDFGPTISPILTSTLLPTHPLSSRELSLQVFYQFTPGWFSQMESLSNMDRARLLRAVGDPFKSASDNLRDEERMYTNEYNPMKVAVVLIEFASSSLWRDHLRGSNFTSCEEVTSTAVGKRSAFHYMTLITDEIWPEFLRTSEKVITAVGRLEELQCPNTAEVVFMWAWTSGLVSAVDHDAWRSIGHKALTFYQAHGEGRLRALARHIMDERLSHPLIQRWDPWCRVEGVRSPVLIADRVRTSHSRGFYFTDLPLARVCQLRRLYQIFGYDPTTREEVVVVEKTEEDTGVPSGESLNSVRFVDCACDYP